MIPDQSCIGTVATLLPPPGRRKARFYFDVQIGSHIASDTEGEEHISLDSARREAAQVAAMLGHDKLRDEGSIVVIVRNAQQQICATATLSLRIEQFHDGG